MMLLYFLVLNIISLFNCELTLVSNNTYNYSCHTNLSPNNSTLEIACEHIFLYLQLHSFPKQTIPSILNSNNSGSQIPTITHITFINSTIHIEFNPPEGTNQTHIAVTIPNNLTIKENKFDKSLYLCLELNDTNQNDSSSLYIDINTLQSNNFSITNDIQIQLNFKQHIKKYHFIFRYIYTSYSSFFGNILLLIGLFISCKGYSNLNISLVLIIILFFQIVLEDIIETILTFGIFYSKNSIIVTFSIIADIIFGIFLGIYMAFKNNHIIIYYICLFGTTYKFISYYILNIYIDFSLYIQYINIGITVFGSILFGWIMTCFKINNAKFKQFIGIAATSLFGENVIVSGLMFMIRESYYDRFYYYTKDFVPICVNKQNCYFYVMGLSGLCLVFMGVQYYGFLLKERERKDIEKKEGSFINGSDYKVVVNLDKTELVPGEDDVYDKEQYIEEGDNDMIRISGASSGNSENDKKNNYGVDKNYVAYSETFTDRNED